MITDLALDNICKKAMLKAKEEKSPFYYFIFFLYNCGVRQAELFQYSITTINDEGYLIINPLKNNHVRKLKVNSTETALNLEILHHTANTPSINSKSLQRYLTANPEINALQIGNKSVNAHVFRHNYIKRLRTNGFSKEEIALNMGYTNISTADKYLNSKIDTVITGQQKLF